MLDKKHDNGRCKGWGDKATAEQVLRMWCFDHVFIGFTGINADMMFLYFDFCVNGRTQVPFYPFTQNRRETAETYLEDGRCSFTNNASENAIRPFTVGRKNWLFSQSVEGAGASAVVYAIVEMAKAHKLNIYEYLKYVLEQRPDNTWTDEQLPGLAPWSEKLQSIKKSQSN